MGKDRSFLGRSATGLALSALLLVGISLQAPKPAEAKQAGTNIYNQSTGLAVDVVGAQTDNGREINLWAHSASATNQQFNFVDVGGGRGYEIVARHSGKCLDVAYWSKADGARVIQWDCHRGANQLWDFVDLGDPKYCPPAGGCPESWVATLIVSKHSGKCLDAGNSDYPSPPRQGAPLQQWPCVGSTGDPWWVNQGWRLGDEPAPMPPMPSDAKQIVDQVVRARRDEGKCSDPSVRLDARLSEVARNHSKDLAANYTALIDGYQRNDPRRGHIGSDGTMPPDRIAAQGFAPAQRAENWSYGTNQTFAQAMDNWLHHDEASNWGHRLAILDCNYRVLGVGSANGHNSRVYWTQNFALR